MATKYLSDDEVFGTSTSYLPEDEVFGTPSARKAGGGRGPINPPPAPATDYSDMATAMQGAPTGGPLIRSVLDQPGPVPKTPGYDPMLNQGYVAEVRRDIIGKAAPEDRMGLLTTLAENRTDVLGRAARQILAEAQAENKRISLDQEGRVQRLLDAPRGPGNVPPPRLGAGAASPVSIPDVTPGFGDIMDGRSAKQIAERRMLAQGVRVADEGLRVDEISGVTSQMAEAEGRRKFAEENPLLGSIAAGSAGLISGVINIPSVAADAFNKTAINPVLRALGMQDLPPVSTAFGTEYLAKSASDFMPKVGKQEMDVAIKRDEFAPWLMSKLAANSPQIAQSLLAAFAPPLRAVLLPGMAGTASGQSFAQGDDSRVALAKGAVEHVSEKLPLGVFDKVGDVLKGMSPAKANTVLAVAGQRALQAGGAITANGLTNAIEEVAAQFGGNVLDKYFQGKDIELTKGLAEAGVVGGVTGKLMSAPQVAAAATGYYEPERQIAREIDSAGRAFENLGPEASRAISIDMLRTEAGTSNLISPAATVKNFTPPDSPTKQAGLVDIEVPLPNAAPILPEINPSTEEQFGLDKLRMGGANVGTTGLPGGLAGAGGEAGGGLIDGSMGAAGPGDAGAPGLGGRTAPIPGVNDRQAVPPGGAPGQQPAGVAVGGEPLTWTGRAKTGYANEQDAQQAMATASTVIDTRQTHDWRVEPIGNGRFQIVGYQKETNLGTQTPQAQQGQTQGATPAGQMAGAAQGGAGGIPAATGTPVELSDTERAGLKLAPTAPLRELSSLNKQLDQQIGVTFSPVKSTDLNDSQRLASAVARLMGKTLTVVHQETGAGALPNGMINTVGGKHLFVADDADDAPLAITVHEAYHGLPEAQRKSLNAALLDLFRQDRKDKFLDEFSYTPDKFEEEAPAMMVQAISKREDFWQELRTKMGNKEFGEVAKTIIAKLGDIITGAKKQYGEDFVNKYISDVEKARNLLTTAYADAMKAQGLQPDVKIAGEAMASNRTTTPETDAQASRFGFDQPGPEAGEYAIAVSGLGDVIGRVVSSPDEPLRMEISPEYMGRRFGSKVAEGDAAIKAAIKWASDGIQQGRKKLAAMAMAEERGLPTPGAGSARLPMASERSRIGMNFKDVVKRTPELQEGMAKLQAGEITKADYDKLVNEYKPVEPYQSVPEPVTTEAAKFALANGKGQSEEKAAKFGLPSQEFKAGEVAQLRLDIPSYSEHGAWVVSVHRPEGRSFSAGKVIGYEPVASVTNAEFGMLEKSAAKIAAGSAKGTIATIMGDWKPTTAAEAKLKADQALKSKDWVQVGMDPERHSYFYDRSSMEPVTAADEVIQIGPLVLAKNPTYGKKSEFMFSNRVVPKAIEYQPKRDNFAAPKTSEFLPSELVERARGYITQFKAEAAPVQISGADRVKAEGLLRPRLQAAQEAKLDYDQKILDIGERTGALGQMLAPIKGIKRAAEKLAVEEKFNVDNIKDLLRSTIVVDSYADAPAVVDEIRKEFEVVRVKNRTDIEMAGNDVDNKGFLSSGYGDVLINVRTPNGTIAEIQINVPEMLAAKGEEGHELYEIERDQPEGSDIRRAVVEAQSEYYREAAAAAARRKYASSEGAPERGSASRSSSSPLASSSLNTRPSGNLTQSSPENEATNLQPGGKEEGTFIGSPDESSISQPLYTKPPRRGAERIGSFDVRTMKDGSIVVYGDSQNIRSQIPEDVKGRVTKDGYLFTNAAAPRVKAALEGRKTAYSRGGQVTEKLPMKDGKYLGAPEKYNTPGKIVALRKQLRMLTLEGERGRYWYENSSLAILRMTGGNVQEARKFVALLAIYSPQARVDSNSTFALRAWAQYKAGQPISVKTGVQDKKATQAMADVDAFWSGEKTGNFFFNLLREIDTSTAGKQGATIDMWMMRAAEYANDAPTATQYAFMENETNRIAQEMGWEPQQVQAAIWVAMKARMENKGVKQRTEATSEKKGWIKFERDAKGKKVRVIIDAQKHRDNWLKHAMEHVPTKADTEQAKFDFADGVGRHIGQLSFEARPGRSTGVLDGIHTAPYAQQVEFQQAVQRAFYDENGTDMLAAQLGLLTEPSDIMRPGVWQGEVSPSTQKRVAMAPAGGDAGKTNVDPAQAELLNVYASVAGLVARQEGVGWHRPFYAGTKGQSNGLDIDIGRALNPTETKDLEAAIGKWMDEKKHANWQNQFALISSPTGIRVVNFGIITNAVLQSDIVKVAEGVLPDGSVRVFASSGDMPTNDWEANPNGQTYVQRIGAAGRSDVLDWARSVLAPRVQRVFEDFAEKYQWGDPGRIQFSNRGGSDAAGGGRDRGVGPQDVQAVTPSYGTPREGAASAAAYHYSTQPRTTLDSVMYGTGLRGAEMARLQGADPRLKQRIYFYIDRGTGINPEAGVGGQAHRVNLQNLYDVDEDALRLRRDNEAFNDFESAVIDAGFDGYMVRDAGPSGNAVLLGRHAVPVEQLGARSRMAGEPVAPARERVLSDAEKISANKMLPAGQVSGKRWAELISRSMPEVYERLAGSPVWQSDKVMYRGDLARELRAQPMFSNRQLPKVSPQSALNREIEGASINLQRYIREAQQDGQLPKLTIGRLPHVLNMLGARTQDFDIATSIVKKVFVRTKAEKGHADELPDITPKQLIEGIYRPAMVLKSKDGNPREFELVLPITSDKGALIVPIKVSVDKTDPTGAVMSIYAKGVSISGGKTNEQVLMKRINDGNLLYLDPGLAKQAMTGRKAGDPKADVKLNGNFVSWPGVWPKLEKMIADRKVKTDVNLMGWIGDNYKPSSSPQGWEDAPAFSQRARAEDKEVASLFRDLQDARGLGRVRALERVDAHPMAETIRRIDQEFMDILERLDDAGLVKINCK
jgi:hypothetical protein